MGCRYSCEQGSFETQTPGYACINGGVGDDFSTDCYTCGFGPSAAEAEAAGHPTLWHCGPPRELHDFFVFKYFQGDITNVAWHPLSLLMFFMGLF